MIEARMVEKKVIQEIEKDIKTAFEEMLDEGGIDCDLNTGNLSTRDFSDYLDFPDSKFIRTGCLVLVLAMCANYIDGGSWEIEPYKANYRSALKKLFFDDQKEAQLLRIVKDAFKIVCENPKGIGGSKELTQSYRWVYANFVENSLPELK